MIVGTFTIPDVDLTGIPLAAIAARFQPPDLALDRIDVKLAPGAQAANVRDAIARAVGTAYTVSPPSIISFPDQRLAQLEIQHAVLGAHQPRSERALDRRGREPEPGRRRGSTRSTAARR